MNWSRKKVVLAAAAVAGVGTGATFGIQSESTVRMGMGTNYSASQSHGEDEGENAHRGTYIPRFTSLLGRPKRAEVLDSKHGDLSSPSKASTWQSNPLRDMRNSVDSLVVLCAAVGSIVCDNTTRNLSGRVATIIAELSSNDLFMRLILTPEHSYVAKWLLRQLNEASESVERKEAERALEQMLSKKESATLLLRHPEVFPLLLQQVQSNEYGEIASALKKASSFTKLRCASSKEGVLDVLQILLESHKNLNESNALTHLCAWALDCWSESAENRKLLLQCKALDTIGKVLQNNTKVENSTQLLLLRTMWRILSDQKIKLTKSHYEALHDLVNPTIQICAHGIANTNEELLSLALSCIASLLKLNAVPAETMLPELTSISLLMDHISKAYFGKGAQCPHMLRASLARLIEASCHVSDEFQVINKREWTPRLMSWISDNAKPSLKDEKLDLKRINSSTLLKESSNALRALVEDKGPGGLSVAREWLAHILYQLAEYNDQKLKDIKRGGPTIGMIEDRIKKGRQSSLQLLQASQTAASNILSPPQLPPNVKGVDKNLPGAYTAAAVKVDEAVADLADSNALKALVSLVSEDDFGQIWCYRAGILGVLRRLVIVENAHKNRELGQLDKHAARMLAILSLHDYDMDDVALEEYIDWMKWLTHASKDEHCKLSSHAERALLNTVIKLDSLGEGLEFHDGVHLLNPKAKHHMQLAKSSTGQYKDVDCDIDADIVFIHGLRGGPFSSWCIATEDNNDMKSAQCWPTKWLSEDYPKIRLLTLAYQTRIFDWEGASLSFREQGEKIMRKLSAAGVGKRPVIFIVHSMGGLMVKEMMMQGSAEGYADPSMKAILSNTKGVVFFSTPHFGSWLASASWNAFFQGTTLKDTVKVLRPGPYLEELNDYFKQFCKSNGVSILSFSETSATPLMQLGLMSLKAEVVPAESAYPGFGEFCSLADVDHVYVCKPKSKEDESYVRIVKFIQKVLDSSNTRSSSPNAKGG